MVRLMPGSPAVGEGSSEFEIIRQAANAYVSSGRALSITAQDLHDNIVEATGLIDSELQSYNPTLWGRGPIIIDVRSPDSEMPDCYYTGHIPGAIHIPWHQIARWENLENLLEDRQMVVCSNTGQMGGQITAILNVLGYNAVTLKWGMTSWISDENIAPGRYDRARDTVWNEGGGYRTIQTVREPKEVYLFPAVQNTKSENKATIITAAIDNYLNNGKRANMSGPELYRRLYFNENPDPGCIIDNSEQNSLVTPFILDVRDDNAYSMGHIPGCLHIFWQDVFRVENLKKLPPDRQILVYSSTGHTSGQIAALLNLLGYNAINLRWGIASWSLSLPGADIAPDRFSKERDCMDYPVVRGYSPALPCRG